MTFLSAAARCRVLYRVVASSAAECRLRRYSVHPSAPPRPALSAQRSSVSARSGAFGSVISEATDFNAGCAEIDEKTPSLLKELDVGSQLVKVLIDDSLDSFDFNDDLVLHEKICIARTELSTLIDNGYFLFALDGQAISFQAVSQCFLVEFLGML